MFITYEKLTAYGACKKQSLLFKHLFPNGIQITAELCRHHADMFDFDWAASRLLPIKQGAEYARAETSALAAYNRARESAQAKYAFERVEYVNARGAAWAEYLKAKASAFGALAETAE